MKMLLVFLLLYLELNDNLLAQQYSVDDIENCIPQVYKIIKFPLNNNKSHMMAIVDTLNFKYPLAPLVNKHIQYIGFLANYSHVRSSQFLTPDIGLDEANDKYHKLLLKDSLFCHYFLEMGIFYLQSQGAIVNGVSKASKPSLTMADLMRISTGFFLRLQPQAENHVSWQLNITINPDYDKLFLKYQPLVEAFCQETITNWSMTKEFYTLRYDQEFYNEVIKINNQATSLTNPEDQSRIIIPAMRELMTKSKVLEKVLLNNYNLNKEWLGFTIVK